jgi:riboflavin synthase
VFTGIIEQQGTVLVLERGASGGRLKVLAPEIAPSLQIAGSIAVNGCCLTIVERSEQGFAADLSPETLRRTSFGTMKPRARVNLERPLRAGAECGGHFVQGHVDGVGRVRRILRKGPSPRGRQSEQTPEGNWWLEIALPATVSPYVAEKGSLAVDGISLTVAEAKGRSASFAVIPYTYQHTNIANLRAGDVVNLEADVLAKYVQRLLEARGTNRRSPRGQARHRAPR